MGSRKGYEFERDTVVVHQARFPGDSEKSYRVERSGGASRQGGKWTGSIEVIDKGDAAIILNFLPFPVLFECKERRENRKHGPIFTIHKSDLDKSRDQAEKAGSLSVFAIKLKGISKSSSKLKEFDFSKKDANSIYYCLPQEHWFILMEYIRKIFEGLKEEDPIISYKTTPELEAKLKELPTDAILLELRKRLGVTNA